jgi:tetratricopeptide (TPR) repeat protein
MNKVIAVGLGIALGLGTALAQPTPTPVPASPPPTKTDEKVGTDESLEHGGDARPWAVGVSADGQARAVDKFRQANAQLNDGLFAAAAKLYRDALTHWDHPAIHYNLALALLNLDQPIEVYDSLEKAIKFGPAPLEKDKFEHAKEYMLLVEKQIATVEVTCRKPGAKVSVDGKEVFTVGPNGEGGHYKGRVKIGKHTFVAEKPGYNAQVDAPFVEPGQNFHIELTLYTAEELTRYRRKWDTTWLPYAVAGGGVALGVFGGLMHLSASSSYDEFDSEVARCNEASQGGGCTDTSVMALRDRGDSKKTIGYVGYGIAGAAIITGAVMAYLNREESYQITADEYKRQLRAQQPTVTVSPFVSSELAGALVFGTF